MSLQVWLPLNGDLKNKGLLNTPTPIATVTYSDNGKTGKKCLKSSIKAIYNVADGNISTHAMTISFWSKADVYIGTSTA